MKVFVSFRRGHSALEQCVTGTQAFSVSALLIRWSGAIRLTLLLHIFKIFSSLKLRSKLLAITFFCHHSPPPPATAAAAAAPSSLVAPLPRKNKHLSTLSTKKGLARDDEL